MFGRIRTAYGRLLDGKRAPSRPDGSAGTAATRDPARKRAPNLFEAAASYVSARAENDQDKIDEAAGWVSPEALSFGVSELACRAVVALARERDESPHAVARALLGLPTA